MTSAVRTERPSAGLGRWFRLNSGPAFAFLIFFVLLTVDEILQPRFLDHGLTSLLSNSAPLVLVATGQFLVILTGGIDLSTGGMISLTTCVLATQIGADPATQAIWIVAVLLLGLSVGALQGVVIHFGRIQPILVTLASLSILNGAALLMLNGPGGAIPSSFTSLLTGDIVGIPTALWLMVALAGVWTWGRRATFILNVMSLGSDESAARMNGIATGRTKVLTYALSGLCAALAGIYVAGITASGDPNIGQPYILMSVAACVIGGTRLSGGRGSFYGLVAGALILNIVSGLVYFAGLSSDYQQLVQGSLLLVAVTFTSYRRVRGKYLRGI